MSATGHTVERLVLDTQRTARRVVASGWHAEAARYRMLAANATTPADQRINELIAQDLSDSADKLLEECP
jgi:hypothetical protein